MKTPKRDTFFADAARRRIDNEFWVAPDGRVVRLRVSDDPDWDIISSIVSMHGAIAEQQFSNCIGYPEDYVRKLGWVGFLFGLITSTVPFIATRSLHNLR